MYQDNGIHKMYNNLDQHHIYSSIPFAVQITHCIYLFSEWSMIFFVQINEEKHT